MFAGGAGGCTTFCLVNACWLNCIAQALGGLRLLMYNHDHSNALAYDKSYIGDADHSTCKPVRVYVNSGTGIGVNCKNVNRAKPFSFCWDLGARCFSDMFNQQTSGLGYPPGAICLKFSKYYTTASSSTRMLGCILSNPLLLHQVSCRN